MLQGGTRLRRRPLFVHNVLVGSARYFITVPSRARALRLLLIIFGSLALFLFAFAYARRVQVAVSLKSAEVTSAQRLEGTVNGPIGRFSSLFRGVFYAGSDDGSDYFVILHGKVTVQAFKMRRGDLRVQHQMQLTADERKWVDITRAFPEPR